ncbi:MAG: hypothetical protein ACFB6R_13745 [Alphaproteobacteria bacterium]
MTFKRAVCVLLLSAVSSTVFASEALDSSQEARALNGSHQFYVWCTGADDFTMTQAGATAQAAQTTAFEALKAEGKATCWPIWQGLVSSGQ